MTQIVRIVATPDVIRDLCIGSVLGGSGSKPRDNATSSDWADMIDGLQKCALESRLGIPIFFGTDAVHGNNNVYGTTIFPHNVGLGATRNNVMACAKHYVGDGGTDKGKNEGNTIISFDDLENIHMLPYLDCISKGVCTIMGIVITDWEGLDGLHDPHGSNYRSAVLSAINAGIDMVMVPIRYQLFLEDLAYLVESGEVSMARIDDAVERILRLKFAAGLFEHPMADRSLLNIVGSKVLVAGKHADDLGYQCGGWTAKWEGASGRITIGTTILDAIKEAIGDTTEVVYEENPTTKTLSEHDFSYAIVAVGEAPKCLIFFFKVRTDKSLAFYEVDDNLDVRLMQDILFSYSFYNFDLCYCQYEPNGMSLVGLTRNGMSTLALEPSVLETLDALVATWLPGTEGNGITDVIFGDYEFHGRLPVSWFRSVDQLPMDSHQSTYDPLFPLGYGLKCATPI
ncbi:hypothetical protein L1987_82495 [Smallanthus sonchifolius]|uniref:Uncharacterized protein n=1 Tax=Smallanthus sonchifolius TaxID=185202 RepID=A0ACB8YB95_9ASTR|nr:hypothetical protein L1987_82495 [Smallanthus sonchifolius]